MFVAGLKLSKLMLLKLPLGLGEENLLKSPPKITGPKKRNRFEFRNRFRFQFRFRFRYRYRHSDTDAHTGVQIQIILATATFTIVTPAEEILSVGKGDG